MRNPTIAAVSTAPGRSSRAILRLSGEQAFSIIAEVTGRKGFDVRSYSSKRCIVPLRGIPVPCTLYLMPGPRSYTREDVAELHTFGAQPLVGVLFSRLLEGGARQAEPGEFTRRAFLNGRIDLSQAEAVLGIIKAQTDGEQRAAQRALTGELSSRIGRARKRLEEMCIKTEASVDFGDQDIDETLPWKLAEELNGVLEDLPAAGDCRRNVPEAGVVTAITGKANSGKSTLFNRLCRTEHALVSPVSGTTRDWLSAEIEIDAVTFVLIDTAGQRQASDHTELSAQEAGRVQAATAQITLNVIDVSLPPDPHAAAGLFAGTVIRVLNKIDLARTPVPSDDAIAVSARSGEGVEELKKKLVETVQSGLVPAGPAHATLTTRQDRQLRDAREALLRAIGACSQGLDLASADMRDALSALGSFLGKNAGDEILDAIFSNFCIGK